MLEIHSKRDIARRADKRRVLLGLPFRKRERARGYGIADFHDRALDCSGVRGRPGKPGQLVHDIIDARLRRNEGIGQKKKRRVRVENPDVAVRPRQFFADAIHNNDGVQIANEGETVFRGQKRGFEDAETGLGPMRPVAGGAPRLTHPQVVEPHGRADNDFLFPRESLGQVVRALPRPLPLDERKHEKCGTRAPPAGKQASRPHEVKQHGRRDGEHNPREQEAIRNEGICRQQGAHHHSEMVTKRRGHGHSNNQ